MVAPWFYFLAVALLALFNFCCAGLNLLAVPGNWLLLAASALFAWLLRTDGRELSWESIVVLGLLALAGEAFELLAGTAGAARHGASSRGLILSVVGSLVGSILGAGAGLPVPVLGPALGALAGGALGALAGAAIGEHWRGSTADQSWTVGQAAFWGRLWGTVGKLIVGLIMAVIATVDALR
jgi:uncharacterized protein YqgC (DUF456 family)